MEQQFGAFTASELYCPNCRRCQPVREKLLLVLPGGELNEFICSECSTSLGQREITGPAIDLASSSAPLPKPPRKLLRG